MNYSVLAKHSQGKKEQDNIFGVNSAANEKAKIVGKENIINASIGAFLDAKGNLITFNSVEKAINNLKFEDKAAYAPIAGLPEFVEAAIDVTFDEYRPEGMFIKGMSTPGGSGAIHHAIWNYTDEGDSFITSDWFWGPYNTMAKEMGRTLETYETFDADNNFNLPSCLSKIDELLEKQRNVLVIINSPAHNPTGFSLTYDDWKNFLDSVKKRVEGKDKNVIVFIDIAYLDFAPPGSRKFFELFSNLPENIFGIISFSMSKGYTLYGYRTGCMIGMSSSEKIIEEFYDANQFSCRGTWSNCARPGQMALIELWKNKELMAELKQEREEYRLSLEERANTFIDEAKEVGLEICPYHSGFFITVPVDNPQEVAKKLQEDNLFLVPLKRGLRIAICAISSEAIKGMATLIKKALN